jgi:hypothetical protein
VVVAWCDGGGVIGGVMVVVSSVVAVVVSSVVAVVLSVVAVAARLKVAVRVPKDARADQRGGRVAVERDLDLRRESAVVDGPGADLIVARLPASDPPATRQRGETHKHTVSRRGRSKGSWGTVGAVDQPFKRMLLGSRDGICDNSKAPYSTDKNG